MDAIRWSTTSLAIVPQAEVIERFDRADEQSRIAYRLLAFRVGPSRLENASTGGETRW
jgi:hypothetical protein